MTILNTQRASGLLRQRLKERRAKEAARVQFFDGFRDEVLSLSEAVGDLTQVAADRSGMTCRLDGRTATADLEAASLNLDVAYSLVAPDREEPIRLTFRFTLSYGSTAYNGQVYVMRNSSDSLLDAVVAYIYSKMRRTTYAMRFANDV